MVINMTFPINLLSNFLIILILQINMIRKNIVNSSCILKYSCFVSCDVDNDMQINYNVKLFFFLLS